MLLGHCIVRSRMRLEDTPVERPELASAFLANDADERRIICLALGTIYALMYEVPQLIIKTKLINGDLQNRLLCGWAQLKTRAAHAQSNLTKLMMPTSNLRHETNGNSR